MINPVPLFGMGLGGKSRNVSDQLLTNLYREIQPEGEKSRVAIYPTPGLELFQSLGASPARGLWQKGDLLYAVVRDSLYSINNAAVVTNLGALSTSSGRVDMSDNGTQLIVVDGSNGYIYNTSAPPPASIASITRVGTLATLTTATPHGLPDGSEIVVSGASPAQYNGTFRVTVTGASTFTYVMASDPGASASPVGSYTVNAFTRITDADFPGADTVTFLGGYFIISKPDSGEFYLSALYNGLLWDALDFATAESNPDLLVRVFADGGQLMLFGDKTTESWGVSGAADFPLAAIGGAASEWGLAARWSLCKFDNSVMFLRKNRLGQVQVAKQSGYQSVAISTPELDFRMNSYAAVTDATAFSYMLDGHSFYQINFPTANESWLYDGLSNAWQKVQSGDGRHRGELQANFLDSAYVTDYENGNLYRLSVDEYTDNGAPIAREMTCRHISTGDWSIFEELWMEMEAGVGLSSGQGSDPQIVMQVSKDGGHTWSSELWAPLGKIGEYRKRAVWRRLGRSRDWLFRFRITDPVRTVFVNAWGRISG